MNKLDQYWCREASNAVRENWVSGYLVGSLKLTESRGGSIQVPVIFATSQSEMKSSCIFQPLLSGGKFQNLTVRNLHYFEREQPEYFLPEFREQVESGDAETLVSKRLMQFLDKADTENKESDEKWIERLTEDLRRFLD